GIVGGRWRGEARDHEDRYGESVQVASFRGIETRSEDLVFARALEGAVEIHRLESGGPVLERFAVRLRRLLSGSDHVLLIDERDSSAPRTVFPLFAFDADAAFLVRSIESGDCAPG